MSRPTAWSSRVCRRSRPFPADGDGVPVDVAPGSEVVGASDDGHGRLEVFVSTVGGQTRFGAMARPCKRRRRRRPRPAPRRPISSVFVRSCSPSPQRRSSGGSCSAPRRRAPIPGSPRKGRRRSAPRRPRRRPGPSPGCTDHVHPSRSWSSAIGSSPSSVARTASRSVRTKSVRDASPAVARARASRVLPTRISVTITAAVSKYAAIGTIPGGADRTSTPSTVSSGRRRDQRVHQRSCHGARRGARARRRHQPQTRPGVASTSRESA